MVVAGLVLLSAGISIYISANKKAILEKIDAAISKNISGKVEVKDISISTLTSFPYLAASLEDVRLLDTVYNKPLLKCARIACCINPFKIADLQHQLSKIIIENGTIHLYTDATGYSNASVLFQTPQQQPTPSKSFLVHGIELENINFLITNEQKRKDFSFHVKDFDAALSKKGTVLNIKAEQTTVINKMVFNRIKGSYLEHNPVSGTLDLFLDTEAKTLKCAGSEIEINAQPYIVSGEFNFKGSQSFHLDLKSNKLKYEKAIAALTPKLKRQLSVITLEEPMTLHVTLDGLLTAGNIPIATAEWQTSDNRFGSGPVLFDECFFKGKFTNNVSDTLPHTDEFSMVTLDTFSGKWRGLLLTGKNIRVNNLIQPSVTFNLSSEATLGDIDNAIGSDALTFQQGLATLDLSYNGPLIADPAQLKNLNATLEIRNGKILHEPKNILLENCNGIMSIQENDLVFKNFRFDFKRSHFTINVQGDNMGNISKNILEKANLQFNIHSPFIHLDEITPLLKPSARRVAKKRRAAFSATAGKIDNLLENSNWTVNLIANKISKGNFYGENLNAVLKMEEKSWNIDRLSLRHAGGTMNATGQLYQRTENSSAVKADVRLQQINIQQLFYGFGNFGQTSLTSDNLRGTLDADAHINTLIDNNSAAIIPRSMTGAINFSLKNGAVLNHKGLEEMKLLFLKNRDMSNIRFAELKDRIDITPEYLYINRMEIQSTAISMYLEGQYDLYGKNTDMLIQVPFSNFGDRDESVPVTNKGLDVKTGLSIWIGAKNDANGEIKFTPRLSKKKFLKDKKEK